MASSLRDWIEEQSTKLKKPDINLLIDLFISTPSDQETSEIAFGVLGDSPQIKTFVKELCCRRQKAGISPSSIPPAAPVSAHTNAPHVGNAGLVGKPTIQVENKPNKKNAKNNDSSTNNAVATPTPPVVQPNLSSYSQPIVLSHSQPPPQNNNPPQTKNKLNPNISFASQVANTSNNNPNANTTSSDPTTVKHSASLNSGVFFTEDDVGVLDIAQLRHKEILDQNKANKAANKENPSEEFGGDPGAKSLFPHLGNKTNKSAHNNPSSQSRQSHKDGDDINSQLGSDFTNRFQVHEKKKKIVKKDIGGDVPVQIQPQLSPPRPTDDGNDDPYQNIVFYLSRSATRTICDCMCRKHRFYANCHDCGRIICLFEGEGDCFYCGSYVINFGANRDIIALYNRAHQNDEKHYKKSKDGHNNVKESKRAAAVQVTSHTRKSLHANPANSVQNDLELIDMLVETNDKYLNELNVKGDGIVCVPNEIFFEKMQKWSQNALGYYYRSGKKSDTFLKKSNHPPDDNNTDTATPRNASSIEIKSTSAYGSHAADNALSEEERVAVGLQKALAFRDTLIQREKEKEKRTKVIDEQNDYYDFDTNIWLNKEEKDLKIKVRDEVAAILERTNQDRTLTIDIDEKTGKIKQSFVKTDIEFQGVGSVGGSIQDLVDKATKNVEKRLAEDDRQNGQVEIDTSTTVISTGKTYTKLEMAERKRVLTRRIDIEKARLEHEKKLEEERAKKEAEQPVDNTLSTSRKKKSSKTATSAHTTAKPLDSQHLSGRALLVFNTLKETLKPEQPVDRSNNEEYNLANSSWASRIGALHQQFDEEYDFFSQNPDQYIAQEFTPLYNDGEMGGGMIENTTDSGCG